MLKIYVSECLVIWKNYGNISASSLVPLPYHFMRVESKCDLLAFSHRQSLYLKRLVNISTIQKRRVDLWLLAGWFPLVLDAG